MGEFNNDTNANLFWSTDGKTWHPLGKLVNVEYCDDNFPDLGPLEIVPNEGGR